jgi:hypothetical protein
MRKEKRDRRNDGIESIYIFSPTVLDQLTKAIRDPTVHEIVLSLFKIQQLKEKELKARRDEILGTQERERRDTLGARDMKLANTPRYVGWRSCGDGGVVEMEELWRWRSCGDGGVVEMEELWRWRSCGDRGVAS